METRKALKLQIIVTLLLSNIFLVFPQKFKVSSNSISNKHINAFAEDKWGYMWIATGRGLCHYNGYEYEYFYSAQDDSTSLPSDFVMNLLVDSKSQLWVATTNGLCRYDYDKNNFVSYTYPDKTRKDCDFGIVEFKEKVLSYGANGVRLIDEKKKELKVFPQTDDLLISTLIADDTSHLWAGCRGGQGIVCLDEKFSIQKKISLDNATEIYCSYKHKDGTIWFGSTKGIIVVDTGKREIIDAPMSREDLLLMAKLYVTFLVPTEQGLLIGTENSGLFIFHWDTGRLQSGAKANHFTENTSRHVTCCYSDRADNLWLGTFDQGYLLDLNRRKKINNDRNLNSYIDGKFVTRIATDKASNLWIGTRYNGLIYYDRTSHEIVEYNSSNFKPFSSSNSNLVQSLYADSNGDLWVEYDKKLIHCIVEGGSKILSYKIYDVKTHIASMHEDARKRIWTGSAFDGIRIFDIDGKHAPVTVPLPERRWTNITKIIQLRSGEMLFSSYDDGIYTVDPTTLKIEELCTEPNFRALVQRVIFLYEDFDDNIWLGTYGRGLIKYIPKNGQHLVYSMSDGLPSNDILGITTDAEENLWLSTSYGLSKFDIKSKRFYNLFDFDGIGGNQFHEKSIAKLGDGTLLFGGNHGLSYFNPKDIEIHSVAVPVIFEDLKVLNISEPVGSKEGLLQKNINETEEITLNHWQNVFSIDYVAIDFVASRKMRYAYKLNGFDKEWNYVGEHRRATYSNLSPGAYVLEVKAQSDDGAWNGSSKKITIHIKAAPWLSTPALTGYFILILAIVYFLNRMYIRLKIDKEKILLIEKKRNQEREMILMKIRFFTNISHELRTPLSMIYGPVKALLDQKEMPDSSRYFLRLVNNNVDRLLRLIDQLLDFGKLESDTLSLSVTRVDICPIVLDLVESYSYYALEKQIEVKVNSPEHPLEVSVDVDKLTKIVSNLLSNSLKYTLNNGHIVVDLEQKEITTNDCFSEKLVGKNCLVIQVTDDGIGIPEKDLNFLFERYRRFDNKNSSSSSIAGTGIGLNYVKRMVEKHHGEVMAKLCEERGMTFCLALPVGEAEYSTEERKEEEITFSPTPLPDFGSRTDDEVKLVDEAGTGKEEKPTLLIVEDNAELCLFMRELLQPHYQVAVAFNGQEGYEKASEIIPDILISDVLMPGMNGYELCEKMKNDLNLCHIPFVILTAKTMEEDLIEGYSKGADVYLSKPFNPQLLKTIIRNVFENMKRRKAMFLGTTLVEELEEKSLEEIELSPLDQKFMDKLYAAIEKDLSDSELNVNSLGCDLGLSRTSFYRKMKALTGQSPNDFLRIYRLKRAAELILEKQYPINEVGDLTGFKTHSHFSSCFKKQFGVSPKDYKN